MLQDHIEAIQSKLQRAQNIPDGTKTELLQLLAELQAEVSLLAQTYGKEANRIAEVTQLSADEATSMVKKPELIEASLQDLRLSVEGFETSHPKMTGLVSQFATTLSNMGI